MLALEAGMPNWDSMNLGMKVIKAVTMAHSAVYDKLTNRKVTLPRIFSAALGMSAGTTTRRCAWVSCQDRQGSIKFFYLFFICQGQTRPLYVRPRRLSG